MMAAKALGNEGSQRKYLQLLVTICGSSRNALPRSAKLFSGEIPSLLTMVTCFFLRSLCVLVPLVTKFGIRKFVFHKPFYIHLRN
jgi:hypothetical protein